MITSESLPRPTQAQSFANSTIGGGANTSHLPVTLDTGINDNLILLALQERLVSMQKSPEKRLIECLEIVRIFEKWT